MSDQPQDKPLSFEDIMSRKGAEIPEWRKQQKEQEKQAEANLTDEQRAELERQRQEKLRLQTEPTTPANRTELHPAEGGSQEVTDTSKVEGEHHRSGKRRHHE